MHIVQMINALRIGGAEKLVVTFARAARTTDIKLTVVTLRANVPEVKQAVLETGARVVELHHRKLFSPGRFYRLVRFLQQEDVDIIHTHLAMANILGAASGRLAGIPVVTTLHNVSTGSENHTVRGPLESWLLNHSVEQVIAVGLETAEAQQFRLGGKEIIVIPNAVEVPGETAASRVRALRQELGIAQGSPLLLSVGRLEPQKGMNDLILAFEKLLLSYPDARLVVAGIGSLHDRLNREIREAGLQSQVQLLGLRNDIPDLLAACDLFVSASRWEGLPVSVLEAMAAGKPVVATRVGDLPQVVLDGMGVLVPPGNPDQLADALRLVIADPRCGASYGSAAREHVLKEYSASRWADRLLALYARVIQDSKTSNLEPVE
jgi:glycosyltransferase involved in cell wall biosynthesis